MIIRTRDWRGTVLQPRVGNASFVRAHGGRLVARLAQFAIGLKAPSQPVAFDLNVECGALRARRFGSPWGRLVLGIPGLSASSRTFDYLGPLLGRGVQQLVALDLRGRGESSRTPPGTYGWRRHAADVLGAARLLQELPCDLVGHSMGAFVAMQAVASAPHRVRRLVLIDAAGAPDSVALMTVVSGEPWLRSFARSAEDYVDRVRGAGLVEPWSDHWERYFHQELVAVEGRVRSRCDRWAVLEDTAHASSRHPRALWGALALPILLVRATRPLSRAGGFMVPDTERAAFVRAIPHAEVVEIDANHLGVMTHPDAAAAIRRFLS
jgi:pimeloyl-ACP methyl ester carboxylesterase